MSKLVKAFLPSIVFGIGAALFGLFGIVGALFSDDLTLPDALIGTFGIMLIAVTAPAIYFLPTAIAAFRECRSYWGILVINCFPGLGHIISLVWALVEQKPQPAIVQNFYQPPPPQSTPSPTEPN